jgi:hypothetical protein
VIKALSAQRRNATCKKGRAARQYHCLGTQVAAPDDVTQFRFELHPFVPLSATLPAPAPQIISGMAYKQACERASTVGCSTEYAALPCCYSELLRDTPHRSLADYLQVQKRARDMRLRCCNTFNFQGSSYVLYVLLHK